jgi:hypothetical protein
VIRQAISCDICASEKKQTNHWFVAYEHGGELRLSGWLSRNRLRPGSKHLCGQTCLHKLVDEFMAKALALRTQTATPEMAEVQDLAVHSDTSLTSDLAYEEVESSARLIPTPPTIIKAPSIPPFKPQPELVTAPARFAAVELSPPIDPPRVESRNRRAEAWERERERESRASERRPDIAT